MPSAIANAETQPPSFPSPSTFSILPDIYLLLSRLELLQQHQAQAGNATTLLQPKTPGGTIASPLTLKELIAAVVPIKQKIQKARTAVSILPDVDTGIAEQEHEIQMLHGKIEAFRARLRELGNLAGQKEDVVATTDIGREEDTVMQESTGD